MTEREPDDWGPEEAAALRALAGGPGAPPELEERLVAALRRQGLLRPRRHWLRTTAAAAAGMVLFVAGVLVGKGPAARGVPPDMPRFVLFLYAASDSRPVAESDEAARVQEYARWARLQRAMGSVEAGQRLEDTAVTLGSAEASLGVGPAGYFIVRASSLEQAVGVARSCPHLRHGGVIVVRPIDPKV
jgi:hypothetical protein